MKLLAMLRLFSALPLVWQLSLFAFAQDLSQPGLIVSFKTGVREDVAVLPNVALYIPAAQSPSAFSDAGPFTAVWNGLIGVEMRSDFSFSAEANGSVRVLINGGLALEGIGTGGSISQGKLVRFSKGTNTISVEFRSPPSGDAFLRLFWAPKAGFPSPLPAAALSHRVESNLTAVSQRRLGQQLFLEHRCQKCHLPSAAILQDLDLDTPAFEGLGSRRNRRWMARWIDDPKSLRPMAHMPKLFRGPTAREDAEDAAAFLSSLTIGDESGTKTGAGVRDEGKKLFETLHCAACHNPPDSELRDKIPLNVVSEKFSRQALVDFLKKPDERYASIRMPNFRLTDQEAGNLSAYLTGSLAEPLQAKAAEERINRGRKLLQTAGCLNCHALKIENLFKPMSLAGLAKSSLDRGCLAPKSAPEAKSPDYGFSNEERVALAAFLATDYSSLTRRVNWEFAQRQTAALNCVECHGKFEGFPPLEIIGGKLKPEWSSQFIAGAVSYKPRPWLEARMPGFAHGAPGLAAGLASLHGYPPATALEPATDEEASKMGQKLVSANGGFSCVSCHAIAEFGATQVFESAGINLAHSEERLLKPYFQRWVRNPLAIDPATKMPVYFDEEGKSPLTEIYDGDGAKQLEAIWQYIRKGSKMPPPPN